MGYRGSAIIVFVNTPGGRSKIKSAAKFIFHLRFEKVPHASRSLSAVAELLILSWNFDANFFKLILFAIEI